MRGFILFGLLIAGLAYLATKYNHKSLWLYRWKLTREYLPKLGELVGLDSKTNISRKLINIQFHGHHNGNQHVKVTEEIFAGIRALLYRPRNPSTSFGESKPGIVFIHDGWIHGMPEANHEALLDLSKSLGITVLAFEYRKAPEYVFPAGYNDCLRGLLAFGAQAKSFDVNPFRLAVIGDGSGANIAAGVVGGLYRLKDTGLSVKQLVLFNPLLQALDFDLPSHRMNAEQEILNHNALLDSWLLYIVGRTSAELRSHLVAGKHTDKKARTIGETHLWGQLPLKKGEKEKEKKRRAEKSDHDADFAKLFNAAVTDPRVSPFLLPPDAIPKLPPVYLVTSENDVLRDEGIAWKNHLLAQGGRVNHRHYDFYHSLLAFYSSGLPQSLAALNDFTSYLMRNAVL